MMATANLVCFTGTPDRALRAEAELRRVGVEDTARWWSFPNPFDKFILSRIPHTSQMDKNIGFFNCSRTHYRIIKTAYELGEDMVMICEDDVRFRKDITSIHRVIMDAPDFDVLLLDGIPPKKGIKTPLEEIKPGWSRFESMRSGACYVLSRMAMKRLIWLYESAIDASVKNRKARICDQWFESSMLKGLSLVMATPNVAIQQTIPGKHNSGNAWRLAGYETLGIDVSDYAEW